MNVKLKYIIFEIKDGPKFPIIFPEIMVHDQTATRVKMMVARGLELDPDEITPISAGFCYVDMIVCHGESETLGLKSLGEDDEDIIEGCR